MIGNSSVTIAVTGQTTGKIEGLEDNQVYFGTEKEIKLKTDLIKEPESTNCKDNPGNPFCVDTVSIDKTAKIDPKETSPASIYIQTLMMKK